MTGRRAAVIGHPITHSLSPLLHRAAYDALGLDDWQYTTIDVTEATLADFVGGLDDTWAGFSVTMPLKRAVLPFVDHREPVADAVGVVNTVLVQPGSATTLVGANTDVYGLVAALREQWPGGPVARAAILGAGATAASALAALGELGCTHPLVVARSLGRTGVVRRAAHRLGITVDIRAWRADTAAVLTGMDIVISTVPAHGADMVANALAGERTTGVLLDVVYEPRPPALAHAWARSGGTVVGGERMLLHQATEQVRLMTGRQAPVGAMDDALAAALRT